MPMKLWRVHLHYLHTDCDKHPLTSAGLYPHIRHMLDLDCYYSLTAEYLECLKVHEENNQLEPSYPKSARCRTQEAVPYSCNVQCVWYESGQVTEAAQIGQQRISAAKKVTEQQFVFIVYWILLQVSWCWWDVILSHKGDRWNQVCEIDTEFKSQVIKGICIACLLFGILPLGGDS